MIRAKWIEHTGVFADQARNYWALTKPRVVALLVLTTIVAMGLSVPIRQWNLERMLAVLVGGWLSAAGASALNQYLDRAADGRMSRTKNRPLPAGRLVPVNALIFASILLALSTVVLWFGANPLAAILAWLGVVYYAGIYTILLKPYAAVNVVIGGGAGAIPVLVGWAAGAGRLQPEALLLFGIVFFWSPPHSWALALLVEKDYREVGIPILPFPYSNRWTKLQIVWYSLILVVITLVPLPLKMFGLFYFAGALLLGGGLLARAFQLLYAENKLAARKMYKYSSLYLGLLFILMLLDRILF